MIDGSLPPSETQRELRALIRTPDLDGHVARHPERTKDLALRLDDLSRVAWDSESPSSDDRVSAARLATHRAIYELNRVRLYWADDPAHYANERSVTLLELQNMLETPWQRWLKQQVPVPHELEATTPAHTIRSWAERDRTPSDSPISRWFADELNLDGYRQLLAVASLNGLVEASQLSRALGGAPDPVQATLSRIFVEEYGAGRLAKKHSSYFARMLEDQGMSSQPEAYFDRVPWEVLGVINHAFYLAENKAQYLRFCGAFTYTEVSTPASFDGYAKAARRLGLSDGHGDYWSLHVREDERHGSWMIDDVALPMMQRFPGREGEVLFGYAQQRVLEGMAGVATAKVCLQAAQPHRVSNTKGVQ